MHMPSYRAIFLTCTVFFHTRCIFSEAEVLDTIIEKINEDEIYDIRDFLRTSESPKQPTSTPKTTPPAMESVVKLRENAGKMPQEDEKVPGNSTEVAGNDLKPTVLTPKTSDIATKLPKNSSSTDETTPDPVATSRPDLCFLPMDKGDGRARMPRFYYNSTTNTCEEFIYGGGDGNDNRFFTKDQCLDECFDFTNRSARNLRAGLDCGFDVLTLSECRLTSDFKQMTGCGTIPLFGSNRQQCTNAGCCWHHSYDICYQTVERNIRRESCFIFSRTGSLFYGVGSFHSFNNHRNGWMAYLTFSDRLRGSLCIVKGRFPIPVTVGNKFLQDSGVILQGSQHIQPGERVEVIFAGSLSARQRLNSDICQDLSHI